MTLHQEVDAEGVGAAWPAAATHAVPFVECLDATGWGMGCPEQSQLCGVAGGVCLGCSMPGELARLR